MKVVSLHLYPLKSGAGISVQQMDWSEQGPVMDRFWMLVDPDGKFMTQRQFPQMALIRTQISNGKVRFTTAEANSMELPIQMKAPKSRSVQIWGQDVEADLQFQFAHDFFSDYLKTKCQLVQFSNQTQRPVKNLNHTVRFPDQYPVLLVNQKSIDDLNSKIQQPIDASRFRPNIVIDGEIPFSEDHWTSLKIGEHVFTNLKPCSRCKIITIDQKTGKSETSEVLTKLSEYRRFENKVNFGIHMIHSGNHPIRVGDAVEIL